VEVLTYSTPSYTGLSYPMQKYYPTWVLAEDDPLVQAAVRTYESFNDHPPVVDKWVFSTNGVGSMGIMGVPTVGFGPGEEDVAHSVVERVPIRHLVEAAKFYAAFPLTYLSDSQ
jgi:acetylornithine deacetylase/succinyl-diaminopimelate desuccinylase-like protein